MSLFDDNITTEIPTRDALETALNIIVSKCADYVRSAFPDKCAKNESARIDDRVEIVAFQKMLHEELDKQKEHGLLAAVHSRIEVYTFNDVYQCFPDTENIKIMFSAYVPTGVFECVSNGHGDNTPWIERQDQYTLNVKAHIYNFE
jgi:hypothetical protein